jgi:hypothetical protein
MISDNINAKAEAIFQEALRFEAGEIIETPIATEVRTKSTLAIIQGQPNAAWRDYMQLFATSGAELDRLVVNDGNADRQQARAYLVANGMCSMGTGRRLPNGVGNRLNL